jgi:hypothetical protein
VSFSYRFRGDTPKQIGNRIYEPGETVESAEPLHNGQLEPTSDEAKQYAQANDLVLTDYAPWQRPGSVVAEKSKPAVKPKES